MSAAPLPSAGRLHEPIASTRHTVRLVTVFLGVAALLAYGAWRSGSVPAIAPQSRASQYVGMLTFLWGLLWFTWRGVHARGVTLGELIGTRWRDARGTVVALAIAVGFLVVARVVLAGARQLLAGAGQDQAAESQRTLALLAPHGLLERALWVLLSASAGFCEELVFRGYLQRQLGALTKNPIVGLVASAVIFGIGHAYQGWRSVLLITLYGLLFGSLARVTRSLLPGMFAHALQDIIAGLFPNWLG